MINQRQLKALSEVIDPDAEYILLGPKEPTFYLTLGTITFAAVTLRTRWDGLMEGKCWESHQLDKIHADKYWTILK